LPGKDQKEAVDQFIGFIRETLDCITSARLNAHQESEKLFKLFFDPSAQIVAKNGAKFYISVAQTFTVQQREDGSYKVHTREYSYVFSTERESTTHGRVAYHWHPQDFDLRDPHLHISLTPQVGYPAIDQRISRAHFPTSRVCLENFILFLIKYYDTKSPLADSKWKRLLKKNKAAFSKQATWLVEEPQFTKKQKPQKNRSKLKG
jgi:hypothetical protein